MITYKGMNMNMQCRDFQYEIGKEYETSEAEVCVIGFHGCKDFSDVLKYYPPSSSRYFRVEQTGEIHESDEDSKVASTKIKILEEVNLEDLVVLNSYDIIPVPYCTSICSETRKVGQSKGYFNVLNGTRTSSIIINNGGDGNIISSTGDVSIAMTKGESRKNIVSSTGNHNLVVADGINNIAIINGDCSVVKAIGKNCIAIQDRGYNSYAIGKLGNAICIVERGDGGEIKNIKAGIIDGVTLKEDTCYILKDGEFVEVNR